MIKNRPANARILSSIVVLATLLLSVTGVSVRAQTVTGTIEGRVSDQTGAVVVGATIALRNIETGQERSVTSNSEGYYRAPFLPIGPYRVAASQTGLYKYGARAGRDLAQPDIGYGLRTSTCRSQWRSYGVRSSDTHQPDKCRGEAITDCPGHCR